MLRINSRRGGHLREEVVHKAVLNVGMESEVKTVSVMGDRGRACRACIIFSNILLL